MNCKKVQSLIDTYFDGTMNDAQKAEVDAHLALCDDCRAEFDAEKMIRKSLSEIANVQAPESLKSLVFEAIEKQKCAPAPKIVRPKFNYQRFGLVAACAVLVVAISAGVWTKLDPVLVQDAAPVVTEEPSAAPTITAATAAPTAVPTAAPTQEVRYTTSKKEMTNVATPANDINTGADIATVNDAEEQAVWDNAVPAPDAVPESGSEPAPMMFAMESADADGIAAYSGDEEDLKDVIPPTVVPREQTPDESGERSVPTSGGSARSGGAGGGSSTQAVIQIIVRRVTFTVAEADLVSAKEIQAASISAEEVEEKLTAAGIAFTKSDTVEDRTEEHRALGTQKQSLEAAIELKEAIEQPTEVDLTELHALTDELDEILRKMAELEKINNTTIVSIEYTP